MANKYLDQSGVKKVLENLKAEIDTQVGSSEIDAANVYYTNEEETVSDLGGISAGTIFNKVSVKDVLDDLLYPYVAPTISLKLGVNGGTTASSISVREIGNPITSLTYEATVTQKSEELVELKYYSAGSVIHTDEDLNGSGTYTYTYTPSTSINSTTAFKARIIDSADEVTDSSTITATFVRPMYIGYVAGTITADTITASDVTGSTMTKLIKSKGSCTQALTFTSGRYVFAYPAEYGNLSTILDPNSFDNTGSFTQKTLTINCLDGTDVSYYVYIFNNIVDSDSYAMTYNF